MEAPEQGIARSGSSSSSSSFDDERESDLLLFRNWLYYRVDSALGERINQFRLLLFVLLVANAVMGNFLWFAGGLEGHRWGDTTFVATLWDTWTLLMVSCTLSVYERSSLHLTHIFDGYFHLIFAVRILVFNTMPSIAFHGSLLLLRRFLGFFSRRF